MSRAHRALNQSRWQRVRDAVLRRAGWCCQRCGRPGRLEVDHRQPMERGGSPWSMDNLQALCVQCHRDKTRREFTKHTPGRDEWMEEVKRAFG